MTAVLVLWTLAGAYEERKARHQHQAERELLTISRLQAQALAAWREARFAEADGLTDDALLARELTRWQKVPTNARDAAESATAAGLVRDRLRILQERGRYTAVAFVDRDGKVLIEGKGSGGQLPERERQALRSAMESADTQVVEPRHDPYFSFPFFSLLAPVFDGSRLLGAVWLVMDVRTSLYPLLSPWPTPSATAESVLVSAAGRDARLLSPLRRQEGRDVETVVSAAEIARPMVQAIAGARGLVYGRDSSGVDVMAAVNAISDSPWYLVSQVQVSEAFGNAAKRELLVLSLPLSLAALLIGVLMGVWQWRARRRESALRHRLAENMQWLESAQQAASIGYFVYEPAARQFKLSGMASGLLGLPAEQLVALDQWLAQIDEADRSEARDAMHAAMQSRQPLQLRYRVQVAWAAPTDVQSQRANLAAHERPIERWLHMWGHWDASDGSAQMTGTVQDITEVQRSEQKLALYRDALEILVRQDALTSLANRRALTEAVAIEWPRAARNHTPVSLLMIDVDFFKAFNDRHGHLAGDDCLRKVAGALSSVVTRSADLVARYGGEEFAVLLPGTFAPDALQLAEKARKAVQELQIGHAASSVAAVVTVSVGVATMTPDFDSPLLSSAAHNGASVRTNSAQVGAERSSERLFHAADTALYAAKAQGRNRVVADRCESYRPNEPPS